MDPGIRTEAGTFAPGSSGNPSGRRALPTWLREGRDELLVVMFAAATKGRIPLAPAGDDDEPEVGDDGMPVPPSKTQVVPAQWRLKAAEALLNRIDGRPPVRVEGDGDDVNGVLAKLYAAVGSDR